MKKEDRLIIWKKYGCHCSYCGNEIEYKNMQVDHIIPKANFVKDVTINKERVPSFLNHLTRFDINHKDNLNPSCRRCNKWKDTFHLELFRIQIEKQPERLFRDSSGFRLAIDFGLINVPSAKVLFYFERFDKG